MFTQQNVSADLDNLSTEDFILKYQEEDLGKLANALLTDARNRGIIPAIPKPKTSAIAKFKAVQLKVLHALLVNRDTSEVHLPNRSWLYVTNDKFNTAWLDIYPYRLNTNEA
jgi:hypothetical protein